MKYKLFKYFFYCIKNSDYSQYSYQIWTLHKILHLNVAQKFEKIRIDSIY